MMKTKQWILVVAMMGVLFATAFANDNDEINDRRMDMMKERFAFFKENIKPKVDAQRNKLESSISNEDKQEVTRLREEIVKQRLMENEFMSEARASRIKGEDFDEGLWQEIQAQKIIIENLYDQAKIIANKYRPEIDDMVADLRQELRSEMSDQRQSRQGSEQGYGKGKRGSGNQAEFGREGRRSSHGNRAGFGQENNGQFGPNRFDRFGGVSGRMDTVGFLLWDVNRG